MKRSKKILSIVLSIALVAGISVGATLALLSAKTGEVKNTFTAGSLFYSTSADNTITLTESKAKESETSPGSWVKDTATTDPVTGNEYTNLVPNASIFKDPSVTVKGLAADSYVYVEVVAPEVKLGDKEIMKVNIDSNWSQITVTKAPNDGVVYAYKNGAVVKKNAATSDTTKNATTLNSIPVIKDNNITLGDWTTEDGTPTFSDVKIYAYICQASGTAAEAFNTAFGS